jgi:glutamate N-acetyltransferase/amino-acid N-acetyltransferase
MAAFWKSVRGGVTAPLGYTAAATACGLKASGKKDLSLLLSDRPAAWGALLTTNSVPAAPVLITKELLRRRRPLQAVVINSGNANAATGEEGLKAAGEVIAAAANLTGFSESTVVMASTGIIGEPLPAAKLAGALPRLLKGASRRGGRSAAEGIMTTDTSPKEVALELVRGAGKGMRIGGMAKGAGMIHPGMATMLAFVTTDAGLPTPLLRQILKEAGEATFNRISVDGDRSTNDTLLLLANGASGVAVTPGSGAEKRFREGLHEVCRRLAEKIVLDGEGATKLVEVRVSGARSGGEALKAARAVANSSLVKTAWYGQDLNWGRIVAALGYSGARVDAGRISLDVNGRPAVRRGMAVSPREYSRAQREMARKRLVFDIDLGVGKGRESVLTCDLSVEYVKENSLYTT